MRTIPSATDAERSSVAWRAESWRRRIQQNRRHRIIRHCEVDHYLGRVIVPGISCGSTHQGSVQSLLRIGKIPLAPGKLITQYIQ